MLTDYVGWKISDEKQRAIEERIIKKRLLESAQQSGVRMPGWLRLQLHYMGVRLERFGEYMQIACEKQREGIADESRVSVQV